MFDWHNIRVDVFTSGFDIAVRVTHLPTGIVETANGDRTATGQLWLKEEAIAKLTKNETYKEWLAREGKK
jgi:hypothetical protein